MLNAENKQASPGMYIGVDTGGTNTRIGLFESLNTSDYALIAKFPTHQSYDEQLRQ